MLIMDGCIIRWQFLAAIIFSFFLLALVSCAPNTTPTETKETFSVITEEQTSTAIDIKRTASSTPEATTTATITPEPSATPQFYDTFLSQISRDEVKVVYSPSVVYTGDKLNAVIYLPVSTPGTHGLPFSEIYYVTVEVYTHGAGEFDIGKFTGTQVTFQGDTKISGSSQEGNLSINWQNPTYSGEISYVYVFKIYPLVNARQTVKGAKMARVLAIEPLQQVTLAGLPDATSQVIFIDDSQQVEGGNGNEKEVVQPPPPDTKVFED